MKRVYFYVITGVILILVNTALFFLLSSYQDEKNAQKYDTIIFQFLHHHHHFILDIEKSHHTMVFNSTVDSLGYLNVLDSLNLIIDSNAVLSKIYSYIIKDYIYFTSYSYDYHFNPTFRETKLLNLKEVGFNYWFMHRCVYEGNEKYDSLTSLYHAVYNNSKDTILFNDGLTKTYFLTDSVYVGGSYHKYVIGIDFIVESIFSMRKVLVALMIIFNFILFVGIAFVIYRSVKDYLIFINFLNYYTKSGFDFKSINMKGVLLKELYDNMLSLDIKYKMILNNYIEVNRVLENFAYITAHDLKTPLRTIGIFADRINRKLTINIDDITIRADFKFIIDNIKKMDLLIDNILVYSKIGKSDKDVSICNLALEIKTTANKYEALKDLEIIYDLDYDIEYHLNVSLFRTSIDNMLNNALKYNNKERTIIKIGLIQNAKIITITIQDNGCGISDRYINDIFHVFNKLDSTGSGLGLSIVKRFFEKLGGNINIKSNVDEYTLLTITIPSLGDDF